MSEATNQDALTCDDFIQAGVWAWSRCCDDCHTQNQEAGSEMCWLDVGNRRAHVCCCVSWARSDAMIEGVTKHHGIEGVEKL